DTGAAVGTSVVGSTVSFDGISVTFAGTPAAGDSVFVSPLANAIRDLDVAIQDDSKIAAASSAATLPGDNTNALAIAKLADDSRLLGNTTFAGFYAKVVTQAGSMSADARDMYKFETNIQAELQSQRDSISGVSLEEEAIAIIIHQRGFEAAARLITVADELMQTVLNI
ncbi:MAG: hypothetical protein FWH25_01520, partial [Syntrophorhabdaceae bacterium]|nr:hypothetical protein [Syntrophorhabdaceae bacterium]